MKENFTTEVKKDIGISLFFLGLFLSLVLGYLASKSLTNNYEIKKFLIINVLVIVIGFLIGILNINKKKLNNFLLSATAFLVSILIFNMFLNEILKYSIILGNEKLGTSIRFTINIINSLALFVSSSLIFPSLKRVLTLLE
ncbi:MAG TPA: hypothetical protein EYH54_01085 [Nautiliaceae bacterium]|nr:hypothetical protein [Nautiliaceae bacterium]